MRLPGVAWLMFTSFSDDEALLDSILAGAAGYVLKQIGGPDLSGAVRVAASGRSLLPPRAASQVVARLRATLASPARWPRRPPQELGVLELIGEGPCWPWSLVRRRGSSFPARRRSHVLAASTA